MLLCSNYKSENASQFERVKPSIYTLTSTGYHVNYPCFFAVLVDRIQQIKCKMADKRMQRRRDSQRRSAMKKAAEAKKKAQKKAASRRSAQKRRLSRRR